MRILSLASIATVLFLLACDGAATVDGGVGDGGMRDAALDAARDAGSADTGGPDSGGADATAIDADTVDADAIDAFTVDANTVDADLVDADVVDADLVDAGTDAGSDAGHDGGPDAGPADPCTPLPSGLTLFTRSDTASVGTPDSYFLDVTPGDPFCATITGSGGTWTVNVSNGTSSGLRCSGSSECSIVVSPGDTTLIVTAVTTDIGSYTLNVRYRPR